MKKYRLLVIVCLVARDAAWALINPNFTPKDLVDQADTIFVASVQPGAKGQVWNLAKTRGLKGTSAAKHILSLDGCKEDQAADIATLLGSLGKEPLLFFVGTMNEKTAAYIHTRGVWLDVTVAVGLATGSEAFLWMDVNGDTCALCGRRDTQVARCRG